jgi:hypothetical protein
MGIYGLVFLGSMPVGGVLMGALGERIGEPAAVALGAACLLTVALVARWRTPALQGLE